jgi:hypothetical protein
LGFRITPGAGERLQTEGAAHGQELGMETGVAAGAIEYGRLEVIEDQVTGTAAEERQGVNQALVELGLALRRDNTWTNGNWCAIRSRWSNSSRARSRAGCDSRKRLVRVWSL